MQQVEIRPLVMPRPRMTAQQRGTRGRDRPGQVATRRTTATRLLAEPAFKEAVSRIGTALRTAGGAPKAADVIEGFLNENMKV